MMTKLRYMMIKNQVDDMMLSLLSGVPVNVIKDFEHKRRDINRASAITVYRLAKALDCHVDDLLEL